MLLDSPDDRGNVDQGKDETTDDYWKGNKTVKNFIDGVQIPPEGFLKTNNKIGDVAHIHNFGYIYTVVANEFLEECRIHFGEC